MMFKRKPKGIVIYESYELADGSWGVIADALERSEVHRYSLKVGKGGSGMGWMGWSVVFTGTLAECKRELKKRLKPQERPSK